MLPFSLFLAMKYLKPKRSFTSVVTVISIVGVLLGVAILVIVLSVMNGFDSMWREKILSFKPHLTVRAEHGAVRDPEAVCRLVEEIPGVIGVAPVIESLALIQNGRAVDAPFIIGVGADRAGKVTRIPEAVLPPGRFELDEDTVVIGCDLAMRMGLSLGDEMLIHSPQNLTVADELYLPLEVNIGGIFDMGMGRFDSQFVITSLGLAGELTGLEEGVDAIYVMTEDAFRFEEWQRAVERKLGPDYIVRSWKEVDSVLFSALSHEKTMMFILLVFITIVAIFCVTNTLIVITVQKTNEIGLLKALGFPSGKIMAAFVWHGWAQCLVGIAAGIGTGLLVLQNLKRIVRWLTSIDVEVFPKSIYGLSEIPWETSAPELARIALFVMVFCTLSSLLPAWRAARLDPVEALRHE